MKRYVLLDRDGTVIVNKHYQKDPDLTELEPNAAEGLRLLRDAGYGLVVLTNQSGIGRGYFTRADLDAVNRRMAEMLGGGEEKGKAFFEGIFCCPHVDADDCPCRKPRPGLVHQAAEALGFVPENAYVIGDREVDVEMGQAVGATAILVRTGYGAKVEQDKLCAPDYAADDLLDAAQWILQRFKKFCDNRV